MFRSHPPTTHTRERKRKPNAKRQRETPCLSRLPTPTEVRAGQTKRVQSLLGHRAKRCTKILLFGTSTGRSFGVVFFLSSSSSRFLTPHTLSSSLSSSLHKSPQALQDDPCLCLFGMPSFPGPRHRECTLSKTLRSSLLLPSPMSRETLTNGSLMRRKRRRSSWRRTI